MYLYCDESQQNACNLLTVLYKNRTTSELSPVVSSTSTSKSCLRKDLATIMRMLLRDHGVDVSDVVFEDVGVVVALDVKLVETEVVGVVTPVVVGLDVCDVVTLVVTEVVKEVVKCGPRPPPNGG